MVATYPVASNCSEDVEVAGVNEIEGDGVEGAFPFLELVAHLVVFLLLRQGH